MICFFCNHPTGWDYNSPYQILLNGNVTHICHYCFKAKIEEVEIRTGLDQTLHSRFFREKGSSMKFFYCHHCNLLVNQAIYINGHNYCYDCYASCLLAMKKTEYILTDQEKIEVKKQAQKEFDEEKFRLAVEQEKIKLKTKKKHWFPWKIRIERIDK